MENIIVKQSPRLYASGNKADDLGSSHYERELSEEELKTIIANSNKLEWLRKNSNERAMIAIHTWMQWSMPGGDTVKWGSDTPITLTVAQLEEMARKLIKEVLE